MSFLNIMIYIFIFKNDNGSRDKSVTSRFMSIAIVFRYQERKDQKQDELPRHATKVEEKLIIYINNIHYYEDISTRIFEIKQVWMI